MAQGQPANHQAAPSPRTLSRVQSLPSVQLGARVIEARNARTRTAALVLSTESGSASTQLQKLRRKNSRSSGLSRCSSSASVNSQGRQSGGDNPLRRSVSQRSMTEADSADRDMERRINGIGGGMSDFMGNGQIQAFLDGMGDAEDKEGWSSGESDDGAAEMEYWKASPGALRESGKAVAAPTAAKSAPAAAAGVGAGGAAAGGTAESGDEVRASAVPALEMAGVLGVARLAAQARRKRNDAPAQSTFDFEPDRTLSVLSAPVQKIREAEIYLASSSVQAHQQVYSTRDMQAHPQLLKNLLRSGGGDTIVFPVFQRGEPDAEGAEGPGSESAAAAAAASELTDPRLTRTANKYKPPLAIWARWLGTHAYFRTYIVLLIVVSGFLLAVQVELPHEYYRVHQALIIVDKFVLFSFIAETLLKWIDSFEEYWRDGWNIFDFVITVLSVVPELMIMMESEDTNANGTIPKMARQLRILRTMRSLKLLSRFRNLRLIVSTIIETFTQIGNIMLLLLLLTFVYGVVGVNVFEAYSRDETADMAYREKFSSLGHAFTALFQMLTLDQWHSVYIAMASKVNPTLVAVYIVSWVWLGAFIFRNIFVGVMVRGFQTMDQEQIAENRIASIGPVNADAALTMSDLMKKGALDARTGAAAASPKAWASDDAVSGPRASDSLSKLMKDCMREPADQLWPPELLKEHLALMEQLCENIAEREELESLATTLLIQIAPSEL